METSTEKQLPVSNNLMEVESAHGPPENMLNGELETIIMASIQTLKRCNKKCRKDEVFEFVNNSLEKRKTEIRKTLNRGRRIHFLEMKYIYKSEQNTNSE